MEYASRILLSILLIIVNIHCSLSLSCYECNPCPVPFSNSSSVRREHNCKWCATLSVEHYPTPIRECAPECSFAYWGPTYKSLSYDCCQTDYCNKSVQTRIVHHMLTVIVITLTCFFRVKMQ
ncbi:unnamed protein product [Schistosoma guineensis]|nr:unnamed protein product [Schistosoma guineensis]